jgi:hypothetical protein
MTPALSQSLSSAARHAPSATVAAFLKRRHQLLIDGTWTESTDGGVIAVFDPATEAQISTVSAAGTADVDRAVPAARRAFDGGPWRG